MGEGRYITNTCRSLSALNAEILNQIGFSEENVDQLFKNHGISLGYFRSRLDSDNPIAAYWVEYPTIHSYLSKDNELAAWRWNTEAMKKQHSYFVELRDDSEPPDCA